MRTLTKFAMLLMLTAAGSGPRGDNATAPALELWNDPAFQKQLLGGDGVPSDTEPRPSAVERVQTERLLPLLTTDLAAATTQLEPLVTPASSASMDFLLANLYLQQDRLDDAAGYYEAAIRKFPGFRRAYKNLGLIRFRQERSKDAIRALTKVVELGGADALTYGLLGWAYGATEQLVAAESAFRAAMLLQPDQIDWKVGLAQTAFRQRKFSDAVAMTEELIARQPDRADYWLLQANAQLGLGQPLKAAENFEVVRRLDRASPAMLFSLGDIYVNAELWDLAVAAYADAIAADPAAPLQRPVRCVEILAQRGALTQAKGLLARIREAGGADLAEDDRRRLLKLEARIAVAEGDGGDAVRVLEEVVSLDPLDGEALLLLGQHYATSGALDKALFHFERAASIEAFEAEAKVRGAQVLVGQSRYAEALPLLRRAQEIKPREDVGRYLEQVERVARTRR